LRIEAYFQQVREILETHLLVQPSNIAYDKRSTHEGFIRCEAYFVDGSVLHLSRRLKGNSRVITGGVG
jgi:hypothetical protein